MMMSDLLADRVRPSENIEHTICMSSHFSMLKGHYVKISIRRKTSWIIYIIPYLLLSGMDQQWLNLLFFARSLPGVQLQKISDFSKSRVRNKIT